MNPATPASPSAEVSAFVRARLPLRAVPDVPAIRLHLAEADSRLHRLAGLVGVDLGTPYWAYVWAGGAALARYLLEKPGEVAGRTVFDLGTGSGLVAIAARLAGARAVQAADVDPLALMATQLNAAANGVAVEVAPGDTALMPAPQVDVVCAGDTFYGDDVARASLAFLERCQAAGATVLIGDPGRKDLPRGRLRSLGRYRVHDFAEAAAATAAEVFTFAD